MNTFEYNFWCVSLGVHPVVFPTYSDDGVMKLPLVLFPMNYNYKVRIVVSYFLLPFNKSEM